MDVFIGTKDMSEGYESDDKFGLHQRPIMLIYEDVAGKEYTQESELSTFIKQTCHHPITDSNKEEPKKAGQWWISFLIGALLVAALAVFLIMRSQSKVEDHEDI
jgi:phosphotransferase system  glucose/maltose/N-acetylglucosamine-specific IIC component